MSRTAKTAIILLCFSLCSVGTFIASTAQEKREPQKVNAFPVKNRETIQRVWMRV